MAKLTRRGFLGQTSVGVATIGMLTTVPGLAAVSDASEVVETDLSTVALSEPLLAHVSDLATGEISLLVGTQEIIYRDPELVMRLLKAVM